MYLKCHRRVKDGKELRYWSIVEGIRTKKQDSLRSFER